MNDQDADDSSNARTREQLLVPSGYGRGSLYPGNHSEAYRYGYTDGFYEEDATNPVGPKILRAIRRGKWIILAVTVLTTVACGFFVYRVRPTFTASTIVEMAQEPSRSVGRGSESPDPENSVNINTKILMFSSRQLLEDVVTKLDLNDDTDFRNLSQNRPLLEMMDILLHRKRQDDRQTQPTRTHSMLELTDRRPTEQRRDAAGQYIEDPKLDKSVSILEGGLKVDHIQDTKALKISFTHPNQIIAARVANGLAEVFIQRNFEGKIDRFANTSAWLDQSTRELKAKVRQAEQALADYNKDHDIFSAQGSTSLASDKLLRLHEQALRAEMDFRIKQSLYEEVMKGRVADLPEAFSDPRVIEIQRQIDQLSVTASQLGVSYGPENPKVQETQQQINQLKEQIESSRKSLAAKIKSDYQRAESEYSFMKSAVEEAKSQAAQQDQASIQYNILKQDVDTARALYNEFLQKTSQANLEQAQQQNSIEIIRPARIPRQPDGPTKLIILLLGPIAGMLAGIGIAFVREQLDRTIRSSADIDQSVQLPLLGVIPSIAATRIRLLRGSSKKDRKAKQSPETVNGGGGAKATPGNSPRPFEFLPGLSRSSGLTSASGIAGLEQFQPQLHAAAAESYRALRTSILLSNSGSPPKIILFTSGQAGDGKTTTVINAAISFALQGSRVLVIDADLRKTPIENGQEITLGKGLSTYLSGDVEVDGLIQRLGIENLWLLPCGSSPPNPSELLGSEKMKSLLAGLAAKYDYIIIDSSPLSYVTDPVILSVMADAVILVVHSGKTSSDMLRLSHEMLTGVGANILGVVLNNIDIRHHPYKDLGPYAYYCNHEWSNTENRLSDLLN